MAPTHSFSRTGYPCTSSVSSPRKSTQNKGCNFPSCITVQPVVCFTIISLRIVQDTFCEHLVQYFDVQTNAKLEVFAFRKGFTIQCQIDCFVFQATPIFENNRIHSKFNGTNVCVISLVLRVLHRPWPLFYDSAEELYEKKRRIHKIKNGVVGIKISVSPLHAMSL